MSEQIERAIETYLAEQVFEDTGMEIPPDTSLLSGFLDSFGLMQLLNFIEDAYDVTIANTEVVQDNFSSIRTLAGFVEAKRAEGSAGA